MDYKSYYLSTYKPNFEEYSLLIKEHFVKSKSRGKTFLAAREKLSKKYQEKISHYNSSLVRNSDLLQIFETRDQLYNGENIDTIEAILEDEVKDFFEDDSRSINYTSYSQFLQNLGEFKGIYDAKNFSGRISKMIEPLYNEGKLDWLKELAFEEVKHYRDHSLFHSYKKYFEKKIEDEHSISISRPTPKIQVNTQNQELEDKIHLLNNDEKIIIRHYLLNMPSKKRMDLDETEVIKILHITEGVFDNRIFTKKSKDITYVSKYRKGLYYYENVRKRKKLKESILMKTIDLKIDKFREFLLEEE